MRMRKAIAALVVGAGVLGSGQLALAAASAPKGGAVKLFITNVTDIKSKVTVTGAVGDYGTSVSEDKNGKLDANGAYTKVTLKHGGFLIDNTGLDNVLDHAKPQINTANCSFVLSGTGPGTLSEGTGAYAGISGTLAITVTVAGITPKKGTGCNFSDNAPTYGAFASATATGHVSFS